MKKMMKSDPDTKEYYRRYREMNNRNHTYEALHTPQLEDEVYGDLHSGLGSIHYDQIDEEADEIIRFIEKLKGDDHYRPILDRIREALDDEA